MCKDYNQEVTKLEKHLAGDVLDNFGLVVHGKLDQWELIMGINAALNSAKKSTRQHAHIHVNTCPSNVSHSVNGLKSTRRRCKQPSILYWTHLGLFDVIPAV